MVQGNMFLVLLLRCSTAMRGTVDLSRCLRLVVSTEGNKPQRRHPTNHISHTLGIGMISLRLHLNKHPPKERDEGHSNQRSTTGTEPLPIIVIASKVSLSGHLNVAPEAENVGREGGQPGPGERSTVTRDDLPLNAPSIQSRAKAIELLIYKDIHLNCGRGF